MKKAESLGSAENMLNVQEKVSIVNELRQEWSLSRLLIVSGLSGVHFTIMSDGLLLLTGISLPERLC
ncbi:hypothetical protein [Escherichia coli]|uniref:hypothetical protein n=1 Tax=Escherichia coli TaxID=562 RepID=UPI000250D161|nr:integrase, catalytic region domain protein [Escherichia coli DEC6C]KDY46533.1 hypothetical protein AB91_5274 [Escherichia coli 2-460-02_S3_C1]KDY55950.1 hypothetical protein AC20_5146 [Escherichia coli 2-460-02_S3_C2]KDY56168.1 hypothetical protein AC49_5099 [Escherichia coli 2-460-02_S3_C3]